MSIKKFDFTQPGGFPLSQDRLAEIQDAYFSAIAKIGLGFLTAGTDPAHTAVRLSGIQTQPDSTLSEGYFFYNGEIVHFAGGFPQPHPSSGYAVYMQITTVTSSLVYKDNVSRSAVSTREGGLNSLVNTTPDDDNQFLFANLKDGWFNI